MKFLGKHRFFLLLAIALLLRLPLLSQSFWLDEAAQGLESIRSLSQQHNIAFDFQPPLFHYIVHFFTYVSSTEWWLRLPSLIAGIGSVAILYMILEKKYGQSSAFVGAVLLATSPFHVFYSQELRPYSLACFFALLSWWTLLSHDDKAEWKTSNKILFTVSTTLGLYTMYLYPFHVLSQLLFVFVQQKKRLRDFCVSLFISALFFLPWLPMFFSQLQVGTSLTSELPGWSQAVGTPQLKGLLLIPAKLIVGQVPFRGDPVFLFLTICMLAGIAFVSVGTLTEKKHRVFWYWSVIPFVVAWVVSFVIPIIQPKRILFVLPGVYALLGSQLHKGKFVNVVLTLLILFQLLCLYRYYTEPKLQRENWKEVIHIIESSCEVQECATYSAFAQPFAPWQWYTSGKVAGESTGKQIIYSVADVDGIAAPTKSKLFVFEYLQDLTDPNRALLQWIESFGYSLTETIDGKNVGFVRVYTKQ